MLTCLLFLAFTTGVILGLLLSKWLPQTLHITLHHHGPESDEADKWKGEL